MSAPKFSNDLPHRNPVTGVKHGFQTIDDVGGHDFGHTTTSLHSFVFRIVLITFDYIIDCASSWNLFSIEMIDGELFTLRFIIQIELVNPFSSSSCLNTIFFLIFNNYLKTSKLTFRELNECKHEKKIV